MGLAEVLEQLGQNVAGEVVSGLTGETEDAPKFSTTSAYQYNLVKEYLMDTYGVSATMAGSFANDFAAQWFESNGSLPQAYELMSDSGFNNSAGRLVTGADFLPPYFDMGGTIFVNTPDVGPLPVPGLDPEMEFISQTQGLAALGISPSELNRMGNFVPRLSTEQVLGMLNLRAPQSRGGGGGGGGGRLAPKFDEATIGESMGDMWRFYLAGEMDEGKRGSWVSDYVKDAGSFAREGGSLGLDAWFKERMRKESRYKFLYDEKPPEIDEDQWVGRYNQVALGTGIRDASVLRETERGASQGIGLGGFQTQLQQSAEVKAQGGFSRQLAATIGSIGSMGRT